LHNFFSDVAKLRFQVAMISTLSKDPEHSTNLPDENGTQGCAEMKRIINSGIAQRREGTCLDLLRPHNPMPNEVAFGMTPGL
jgi:hypothetical protein